MSDSEVLTEAQRRHVADEAAKALRLAWRYRGSNFADDELEYAAALLGEELPYHPRKVR